MQKQPSNSYGQILKSSSIIGGAQAINYIVGMVRTKLVAVLLGPSGVGLVGLYVSATGLVSTLAGLGIGTSGVREVAEAHASGDQERVARTVKTLRRACWITGIFGCMLTAALAYPLSLWTFGSGERTVAIAILGVTLLLGSISAGQTALLQGIRRIGDLARLNVAGVVAGTVVAVVLYWWLGKAGIVPVLIATAAVNLAFSWWFARRILVTPVQMDWGETWAQSKRLLSLGLAFMWCGLMTAAVALVIRAIIVRKLGLDANGIYQAAWGISGMFAGFILGAMGTDFYPRLTAAAKDNATTNKLVNEQTEIGILLALPGLLATLTFAPLVMKIFYTEKFLAGAELLPCFVLGVFGQVISWPMGFVLVARGESRLYFFAELVANALRLTLSVVLLEILGLWGIALAFALLYVAYTALLLLLSKHLTGFYWSSPALTLIALSAGMVLLGFATQRWVAGYLGLGFGLLLTGVAAILSLRGITLRLGNEHRAVKVLLSLPLLGRFLRS